MLTTSFLARPYSLVQGVRSPSDPLKSVWKRHVYMKHVTALEKRYSDLLSESLGLLRRKCILQWTSLATTSLAERRPVYVVVFHIRCNL